VANDRRAAGAGWEQVAREYLEAAGLRLIVANQGYRVGEIDLVMRDGEVIVFVEVRYRRAARFGGSALSVDAVKQRKLVMAAQCYLAQNPKLAKHPCRFDVVAVEGAAGAASVEWIRNAFDGA
jgi:putative endonuclease